MGSVPGKQTTIPAIAGADLSALSYVFVKHSSTSTDAREVVETTAAEDACGILQIGAEAGKQVEYVPFDGSYSKLTASAAIAVDVKVGPTTGGKGVGVTADKKRYYAIACEAATADNDVIVVKTNDAYISAT